MVGPVRRSAAVVVTVALMAAGCGPDTGDGDLVDDWAALADPAFLDPVVGCHDAPIRYSSDVNTVPTPQVPCERAHTVETFHVGRFPDTVTEIPAEASAPYQDAFGECERLATTFLGGQWYDTRVDLAISVPSGARWDDGGRWYRCEVMETNVASFDLVTRRTASLRDAARPGAPLAQRCVAVTGVDAAGFTQVPPLDCAQPHDAEYAGALKLADSVYPRDPRGSGLYERCRDVVAGYLGGTREGIRLGYLALLASERSWIRGDRYLRCFAWRSGGKLTGTVKGLGNAEPR